MANPEQMSLTPFRLRRGRRTDFIAVMELLALSGTPIPPADRATLRRFRHLTADLGTDLYLAVCGERVVGIVHVTYARQLTTGTLARIEILVVAPDRRFQGIGAALVALARQRAQRRGCAQLLCGHALPAGEIDGFFAATGWQRSGTVFSIDLAALAG